MNEESKRAVALRYDEERDSAPRVVAKGRGWIAEKIIEIARQHGVPIREDKILIETLSKLDLYEEIPVELYKAVAEILAFIYKIKGRR
ncbi:MAG: EscU/YscU/HrcU family type III secretion system export apparatus switch protein [Thermodesulfovibrio sp.]|nr:EscU/YscU/HrcU family type III secretion system export apparatus switch protein [Thermodesulfovibrio sp.]